MQTIKAIGFHPVMGQPTANQGLQQEEECYNEEVFACPPLARCECPRTWRWRQQFEIVFITFPPQEVKFSKEEQDKTESAKKHDKAEGAPDVGLTGWMIADERLVGPVVGVGVVLVGPVGHRSPRCPGKVGGQVFQFFRVLDVTRRKARCSVLFGEKIGPIGEQIAVGSLFTGEERQLAGCGIVAICLEFLYQLLRDNCLLLRC